MCLMTLWQDEYRVYFVLPIELLLMKLIYCILPISLDIEFLNKTDKLIVYYYSLLSLLTLLVTVL